MKKFLFIVFLLFTFHVNGQRQCFESSYYLNGEWSDWTHRSLLFQPASSDLYGYLFNSQNNFCGLWFYKFYFDDIRSYWFKVNIDYMKPTKKEIKNHQKNKKWYEFEGTVEYYVDDDYPTLRDLLKRVGIPVLGLTKPESQVVKRTVKAKIKIAPFKKFPTCFNILFDGIGVAIQIREGASAYGKLDFDKKYFIQ